MLNWITEPPVLNQFSSGFFEFRPNSARTNYKTRTISKYDDDDDDDGGGDK
jgi:hypothetical protein